MISSHKLKKILIVGGLLGVLTPAPILTGPLLDAVRRGDVNEVEKLLKEGFLGMGTPQSDTDEKEDFRGMTPLRYATLKGHKAVARLLLKRGAHIEAQDSHGNTPLHIATLNGQEAITRLLLERNAHIEAQDEVGRTPLYYAAAGYNNEAIVHLLLERRAHIEIQDTQGDPPLHIATECRHETIIRLLLERGAHIEAQDKNGWTPLHIAAGNEYDTAIAHLLIKHGANIYAKDKYAKTPLHIVCERRHRDSHDLLSVLKTAIAFGAQKPPKYAVLSEEILKLFDQYSPVGTLKAHAARACYRHHLEIENELIPNECKEYVLTDEWMDDFLKNKTYDGTICSMPQKKCESRKGKERKI